ncbi:MAG: peptidyl-prolyl cis-trans isomerase [Acidobacteria bacterium]|nr:peptidyl-prolyl cis-trans isomerase [Acidobacteriota bacterium]
MTEWLLLFALAGAQVAQQAPVPEAPPAGAVAPPGEEVVEEIVAWINDDIITRSDLREAEQAAMQQLMESSKGSAAGMSDQIREVSSRVLVGLISDRLLIQEAERLFDIENVKKDLVKRFKERQQIKTEEELDRLLERWGMSREEMMDRLLASAVPDYVVDTQVTRNLGVSEKESREYYEQHRDRFTTPGRVMFREIVLLVDPERRESRRAEAERIVGRARAGEDFTTLVRELSEGPSKALDGLIGPLPPSDLAPEIARAVSSLQQGAVSDPIATPQGWHIIRVEERKDEKVAPFDEVRLEAEQLVREQKLPPAYETYVSGLWKAATIEVRRGYASRIGPPWSDMVVPR